MKHLVIYREDTQISSSMPMPAIIEMVEASARYMDELKRKGKVTDAGFLSGEHGAALIFEVDSHTELHELIERAPGRMFCSVKTWPLMDTGEFMQMHGKLKGFYQNQWESMTKMQQGGTQTGGMRR